MKKIFYYIAWLGILSAIILIGLSTYWLFFYPNPIEFKNLPHKVESNVVKSGGYIIYDIEYCKLTKHVPTVSRTFVDGIIYMIFENRPATEKPMGCGTNRVQLYIPKALPIGEYIIKSTYHYQLNPLKHVDITTETQRFTVTNGVK